MIKTVLILLILGYLMPLLAFLIIHFKNFSKSWAKIKWWTIVYPLGVFGLTEFFMFFPAWWTRNIPILKWLFWIWMDDTRFDGEGYANDYWEFLKKHNTSREDIWIAYKWHIRNRIWNLDTLFRPKSNERGDVEIVIDELYMNDEKVDQLASWFPMARLKYWNNGVEGWDVNSGQYISKKHSIFGKGYVWEEIGGKLTFRYSFNIPFLWMYVVFVSGFNGVRNAFTLKPKRKRPIK